VQSQKGDTKEMGTEQTRPSQLMQDQRKRRGRGEEATSQSPQSLRSTINLNANN